MAKPVFYSVLDAPGGLFDVVVRMAPDRIMRRDGFLSLAQADEWIEGLRSLMTVLGAPVAQDAMNAGEERSAASPTVVFVPATADAQPGSMSAKRWLVSK